MVSPGLARLIAAWIVFSQPLAPLGFTHSVSPNAGNDSSTAPAHIKHDFNMGCSSPVAVCGDFVIRIARHILLRTARSTTQLSGCGRSLACAEAAPTAAKNRASGGSLTPAGFGWSLRRRQALLTATLNAPCLRGQFLSVTRYLPKWGRARPKARWNFCPPLPFIARPLP